jgi:hypothetical protein
MSGFLSMYAILELLCWAHVTMLVERPWAQDFAGYIAERLTNAVHVLTLYSEICCLG